MPNIVESLTSFPKDYIPLRLQVDHIQHGEWRTTHAIYHFLSNSYVHSEFGYASVHNQVLDEYQDLEGDSGGHAWFSVFCVKGDQLGIGGVYCP